MRTSIWTWKITRRLTTWSVSLTTRIWRTWLKTNLSTRCWSSWNKGLNLLRQTQVYCRKAISPPSNKPTSTGISIKSRIKRMMILLAGFPETLMPNQRSVRKQPNEFKNWKRKKYKKNGTEIQFPIKNLKHPKSMPKLPKMWQMKFWETTLI